ncbi:FUSC family protein [Kitasatospora sp. NPDC048365]|uniref:FUSC family protein n=1 Tax=Kitasatospora sp. NPDC048365 TaxID=3364050 RepID=UPI00371DF8D8
MPNPRPSPSATPSGPRRLSTTGVAQVLSPRGALVLTPVDGALGFAVRAALAMALPALPIALAGHPKLAVYAMLGAFTTTFGRNLPYRRRVWVLALVAVAMTAAVGCGSALAVWAAPRSGGWGAVVVVAATAVVAGTAKFVCDAARLSGLGAVLLLFSFAVAANGAPTGTDVPLQTAVAAAGAASAWALSLTGWLWHPERPQRLVVAAALRALAELMETGPGAPAHAHARARHGATAAVLRAYGALGVHPPTAGERGARGGVCLRLTDLSWSLLIRSARRPPGDPAALSRRLRSQVRLLVDGRRRSPVLLAELSVASTTASATAATGGAGRGVRVPPSPFESTSRRAAELLGGRGSERTRRLAVFAVPALRMTLGTGAAGALALALGLGHGYWAAISAAAVLHSVSVRTTTQRAVQRTVGTLAGLLIAVAVLAAGPGPTVLAVVIVVLEFLLEYFVVRNYALGVVFVTPLALLMSELTAPVSTGELVLDRALGSLLGIGVGLLCALLVVHDRAAVRVDRALAACTGAADATERVLGERAGPGPALQNVQVRLAAAVVELREADDAAAGELWEAGVDPAVLAAEEERAYLLLDRLLHGG